METLNIRGKSGVFGRFPRASDFSQGVSLVESISTHRKARKPGSVHGFFKKSWKCFPHAVSPWWKVSFAPVETMETRIPRWGITTFHACKNVIKAVYHVFQIYTHMISAYMWYICTCA